MFELFLDREIRHQFDIVYTAVACSCNLAMILEVYWPHWRQVSQKLENAIPKVGGRTTLPPHF